ncbi:MAG: hypothetical protein IJD76_03885 [Bacilli bacterium]|nr:hypothetical protein [Bacilli bacterium]
MYTKEDIQQILNEIEMHLTDNFEENFKYIMSKIKYYREQEDAQNVVVAIYDFFKGYLSGEDVEKFKELIKQGVKKRRSDHQLAVDHIKNKKFKEASLVLEHLIKTFPFKRSEGKEWYAFAKPFELVLFATKYEQTKLIQQYEEPVSIYFYQLAYCKMMEKDFEGALEAINRACQYDPTSFEMIFLKAGIYDELKEPLLAHNAVREALEYAYLKEDFMKAYYLLGLYFAKRNDDLVALACLTLSTHFRSTKFNEPLKQIVSKKCIISLDNEPDKINEILMTENVQFGPSATVMSAFDNQFFEKVQSFKKEIKDEFTKIKEDIFNDEYFMLSASVSQIQ